MEQHLTQSIASHSMMERLGIIMTLLKKLIILPSNNRQKFRQDNISLNKIFWYIPTIKLD